MLGYCYQEALSALLIKRIHGADIVRPAELLKESAAPVRTYEKGMSGKKKESDI